MKMKPDLGFWKLWNLSFGFFGVQIAYALQSSQVSRIFSTIGADPHDLSYFWILPPLMGLIVQPIVGMVSDRTWNRFGRRLPFLLLGAAIAIVVMCLLPNSGSFGLSVSTAIIFGLVMLMFLDTSINMAMQPFKMLVGDMVNEKQKGKAYAIQSFLCNAGSVVGYVAPFVLAWFLSSTAPAGKVPPTVTFAFYLGAAILLLCVWYSFAKIKEWPPQVYNEYNAPAEESKADKKSHKGSKFPTVFWTLGIVQFFCWAAFLYMWTYSTDAIAGHAFDTPAITKYEGIEINGQKYTDNYLFDNQTLLLEKGKLALGGIKINGKLEHPSLVVTNAGDTLVKDGSVVYNTGIPAIKLGKEPAYIIARGDSAIINGQPVVMTADAKAYSAISLVKPGSTLTMAHIAVKDKKTGEWNLSESTNFQGFNSAMGYELISKTVLNTESENYQKAGDWNGILLAFQGIIAVIWAALLPRFRSRKFAYSLSLALGGLGFLSIWLFTNQYVLLLSYGLAGVAWAAMLSMPFTILTNAISGGRMGTILGLFNCTICIPQIIAALLGGQILKIFPISPDGVAQTVFMLMVSGILLIVGSLCVWIVKEKFAHGNPDQQNAAKMLEAEVASGEPAEDVIS